METVLALVLLILYGMWIKRQNTKHIRELVKRNLGNDKRIR